MTTPRGSGGPGELLARVTALGGYCSLAPAEAPPEGPGKAAGDWLPLARLVASPAEVGRRAERLRDGLAARVGVPVVDVDARAAASTVHLGLAARLLSPVLAATVLGGVVPDLLDGRWRWRDPEAGEPSVGLTVSELVGRAVRRPIEQAETLRELLLVPVLLPLEDGVHDGCGVSRRVLRGNVASALAGAATVLSAAGPAVRRPARALVTALLQVPELTGHGGYEASGAFRRTSCCLYYRLAHGGLCGDCVLAPARRGRGGTPPA
jgi:hypothetical protein